MFIAVRQGRDGSWVLISEHAPDRDPDRPPTVVPVGQLVELIPGLRVSVENFELPGSRVIDVVGVDARGDIVLALARLAQSTEIRQVCFSSLLELAAQLRRDVPFREFEQRLEVLKGRPLDELVLEALPEEEKSTFDSRAFRLRLAQNLEQGRFRLVLAVDRVTAEMESFLDYIRSSSEGMIRFEPVEMATFDLGGWQIMVPRVQPRPFPAFPLDESDTSEDADDRQEPVFDLDVLSDEDALPEDLAEALGQMGEQTDRSDPLYQIYEDLRRAALPRAAAAEERDGEEAPELALSISGAARDEDTFFRKLRAACSGAGLRRARRVTQLGREPSRTLPAGWIVSEETLSFQMGFFRGGTDVLEPQVTEIFRLQSDGCLVIDPPLLRATMPGASIDVFMRDLCANASMNTRICEASQRVVAHIDELFESDQDARTFCIAVRKLILGLGLLGSSSEDREAA